MRSPFRGWKWQWSEGTTVGIIFCTSFAWCIGGLILMIDLIPNTNKDPYTWWQTILLAMGCFLPVTILVGIFIAAGIDAFIKELPNVEFKAPIGRKELEDD